MARRAAGSGIFGWCSDGHHDQCVRAHKRFFFDGKKMVYTDEMIYCACKKRSCKCSKQAKERKVEVTKPL